MQKTLKEKLGADMEPYLILGACNPRLAHLALLASLLTTTGPERLLTAFAVLMLCGELVKIRFVRSTGFPRRSARASLAL